MKPSVCIVGAGAAGLCTAVHLLRRGISDVTVLERDHPAGGSSGLSIGIIETQYVEPLDIDLRAHAMTFFKELERDHNLEIVRTGYLRLGHDAEAAERFAASAAHQHGLGLTDVEVLEPREIRRLAPDMAVDEVVCGLWGPSDGFIDGHLYCALLAEIAANAGAQILVRHRLVDHELTADGSHVLHTDRGEFTADYVVNASGPWGSEVARLLGTEMPLTPQRHEAVVVHLPEPLSYVMPMVMDYTPHSGEIGLYFRHERPGQLIAGLHSEEANEEVANPDDYARSASPEFLETVAWKISERLPSLSDAGLAHGWAGLYPISPDGVPQVGPAVGCETVIAAGGGGGSGIQLSPVLGELAADWIADGAPQALAAGSALAPRRPTLRS
jgi:sarcosine oxidase, subunit beta